VKGTHLVIRYNLQSIVSSFLALWKLCYPADVYA